MAESAAHAPWMLRSADAPSPRQEYVMDQVFCRWFKTSWAWDRREDGDETVLELEGVELGRWLDHPLVTSEVRPQDDHQVEWTAWQHGEVTLRVPCAVDAEGNGWPFDPLAATFHALTCWEEQAGRVALDEHGRPRSFPDAWRSLQGTIQGFGQVMSAAKQPRWPWVDVMWHAIAGHGLPAQSLVCDWTFDVDVAFKHKGRSCLKSWLLQLRDFGLGRWAAVQERFKVNRGWMQDPYDTYDWLLEHHRGEQVTFHMLAAMRNRPYDVGLDPTGTALPLLVEALARHPNVVVRWHPGWRALEDPNMAQAEQARLKPWSGMRCDEVRTHFLRGCPGELWRQWVGMGISVDSSLGWAHDVGFRAGTSRDFMAFDVMDNKVMPLELQPMVAMDEAMRGKLGWSAPQAEQHLTDLLAVVATVGGGWRMCWHNTSVSDTEAWIGWKSTYVGITRKAHSKTVG